MKHFIPFALLLFCFLNVVSLKGQTPVWGKFEKAFKSAKTYSNALYEVEQFSVEFSSPSGSVHKINGFWHGDDAWNVRFMPNETGTWKYRSVCSDKTNTGLNQVTGTFECIPNGSKLAIYQKGAVQRPDNAYYLSHADRTPFFFTACTAWNGALKSTPQEWEQYLTDRVKNDYNVIQFVTTQWRGADRNSEGQVAFEGKEQITINPAFFKHLDKKVDEINRHGLVAAPVLLWALPVAEGRELNPGHALPEREAILLAKYMVARYGGNHVIWILGGDGKYIGEYEQRWKNIGRGVFGAPHPGAVALHPGGQSWIGKEYANEKWLDIIGYQSGHEATDQTAKWMTAGPVATGWAKLPPKVFINMEPCYEEIAPGVKAKEVRNASYWSLFSTPVAGITYGASGIWPWIRPGEKILNHGDDGQVETWDNSVKFPGSIQIGIVHKIMAEYPWQKLRPAQDLLVSEQGNPQSFISVSASEDRSLMMVYMPQKEQIRLSHSGNVSYKATWIDVKTGQKSKAKVNAAGNTIEATPDHEGDRLLVLERR